MCNNRLPTQPVQDYSVLAPYELPLMRARQESHISWTQMMVFSTRFCFSLALNHTGSRPSSLRGCSLVGDFIFEIQSPSGYDHELKWS